MKVLCNGVWDVFHIGHLLHLKAAALMGDELVVSITRDEFVNKGPDRPMFNQTQREAIIAELKCVSSTLIVRDSLEALQIVRPDIFVKGREYEGKLTIQDDAFCREHGIKIAFTDEPIFSSTKIIHELRSG